MKKLTFLFLLIFSVVLLSFQNVCRAQSLEISAAPLLIAAQDQLEVEHARYNLLANHLQKLQQEKSPNKIIFIDEQTLRQAGLAISLAQADLNNITVNLSAAQQTVNLTDNNIRLLESQIQSITSLAGLNNEQQIRLAAQIKNQRILLGLQQSRIKILQQTQDLARQILSIMQDWKTRLQVNYNLQQHNQRQQALDLLAQRLQREQQNWLKRLNELQQQVNSKNNVSILSSSKYAELQLAVFEAEEKSNLSQIELDLAKLDNRLEDLSFIRDQNLSLATLNTVQRQVDILSQQLKDMHGTLQNKINLLKARTEVTKDSMQNTMLLLSEHGASLMFFSSLQNAYEKKLAYIVDMQNQAANYQELINQQLKWQLATRQRLPGFDTQAWILLGKKLLQVPALALQTVQKLRKPIISALYNADAFQLTLWWFVGMGWLFLWYKLRRYLDILAIKFERRNQGFFAEQTLIISLQLLRRHFSGLMLLGSFIGLLFLLSLSAKGFGLIVTLCVVILSFSVLKTLARIILLENIADKSGADVILYHRLRWALLSGGVITVLTILVNQLPVAYDVKDLFGRLFMLFLLVVAIVLLKGWRVVPSLLEPYLSNKKPYLREIVRWLSLLIPVSLLFNALLGLVGYVELAWAMAAYQGLFLIVVSGYILVRGLVDELMRLASEQLIRRIRNGWLWSEAFLKPIHQLLKIAVLISAFSVLFNLYGWGRQSIVVAKLYDFLLFHLATVGSTQITFFSIVQFIFIVAILKWAARWTREFSYRWFFAQTKDLGLRNSLSILTQYSLVLIGITVGLKILGIDVTGLYYVFSAFIVAVGFGLRDLANNFASGILLLMERPIKVGDWVTVGSFEGEVIHIGARAVTIATDDHQELLVPNADIFSKPMINWTHRDSVVRALIFIKLSREDDPHRVRNIILEVLSTISKIVNKPKPEVYFKEIENMLLEFKIEYYVDLKTIASRSEVRSQFLFALWDRFKTEGIHPPHYPHEIHLQGSLDE